VNALRLNSFGDPASVVELVAEPELHPGRDEVLVALEAAPVHPSDLHLILGFYGVHAHGTWADQALVADDDVLSVGDHGDALQLAMVGVNPLTALLLLHVHERLSPGDWIAQTGANSAVGQYVIKLAKLGGTEKSSAWSPGRARGRGRPNLPARAVRRSTHSC
jgi:NADPH:quinone reductase-like Zn-dependent oxidoreductase